MDLRDKRILTVDDHATNRTILHTYLQSWDCESFVEVSSKEVLAQLRQAAERKSPFDMAIIDLVMPEMDGYEAARTIRKSKTGYRKIPIIAMTANAMKGDDEECFKAGMNDYIAKPIDPALLIKKINRWTGQSSSE